MEHKRLGERNSRILEMLKTSTYTDVGKAFGISRQRVEQIASVYGVRSGKVTPKTTCICRFCQKKFDLLECEIGTRGGSIGIFCGQKCYNLYRQNFGSDTNNLPKILKLKAEGKNQTQIGAILGMSQTNVSRILVKFRKR